MAKKEDKLGENTETFENTRSKVYKNTKPTEPTEKLYMKYLGE